MENQLTPNNSMVLEIRELLENARKNVAQQVNTQLLTTYWNIGRIIVEYEQQNQNTVGQNKEHKQEKKQEVKTATSNTARSGSSRACRMAGSRSL